MAPVAASLALLTALGAIPLSAALRAGPDDNTLAEGDLGRDLVQIGVRAEGELRVGAREHGERGESGPPDASFAQAAAERGANQDYLLSGYKNGAPRGQISRNQWEQYWWTDRGDCDYPRGDNWRVCGLLPTNNSQRDVFFRSGFYYLLWSMDSMSVTEFYPIASHAVVSAGSLSVNSQSCVGPSDAWNNDGKGYPIRHVRTGRYYAHYWVGGLQCGSYSATLEIKSWPDCFELYLTSDTDGLSVQVDVTLGAFSSSATGTRTADLGFCVTHDGAVQEKWASPTRPVAAPADAGVGVCLDCATSCGTTLHVQRTIHWSWAGKYYYFCAYPEDLPAGCPYVGTTLTYASGVSIPSGVTFVTASVASRQAGHDVWCRHHRVSGSQAYMMTMQPTVQVNTWAWGTVFHMAGGATGHQVSAAGAGWHVELPTGNLGANDNYDVVLSNTMNEPAVFRLLFHDDFPVGITGQSVFLRNHSSAEPSGFHVQISKNWHTTNGQEGLAPYDGKWLTAVVVLRVPAQSSLTMQLIRTYTFFNSLYTVSHAQLSLIGWGSNGHWDQVGLASNGESITYEPCAQQTRTTGGLDIRPFLTCGMDSAHGECLGSAESPRWTQNHGGQEFLAVFSDGGAYEYLTEVETYHVMNGPKLTNASYTGTTVDNGMRRSVHVSTWAADDMVRHLHTVRYEVLKDVTYPRLTAYSLGADRYNVVTNPRFVYGDGNGRLADVVEVPTIQGGRYYVNESWTSCTVPPCWFAMLSEEDPAMANQNAHRGLVVRKWAAKLGGALRPATESPRFMLTKMFGPHQSLQLTLPEGFDSLQAGDYIEAEFELFLYPNSSAVYIGTNPKMQSWLSDPDAYWNIAYKEAVAGHLDPQVSVGTLERAFPLRVRADSGQVQFQVDVSADWPAVLPITISGVSGLGGRLFRWTGGSWVDFWSGAANNGDFQVDGESGEYSVTFTLPLGFEGGAVLDSARTARSQKTAALEFAWATDGVPPSHEPTTPGPTASPTSTQAPTISPTNSPTVSPTSSPNGSPTSSPTQGDQDASATDDPHLVSLAGERFNIGAPSTYTLLRVPKDEQLPALLQIMADVNEDPGVPCALYMRSIELSGEFLQGVIVQVLPLARNEHGSNSAGSTTERPFSVVEQSGGNSTSTPWDRARQDWAAGGRVLGPQVDVRAVELQELSHLTEGEAFEFTMGSKARVLIQQASHQALNLKLLGLGSLGVAKLGGLLGTEKHSPDVEKPTERCRALHASEMRLDSGHSVTGSMMAAFW